MPDSDDKHSMTTSSESVVSNSLLIRATHIVLLLMAFMYLLVFAKDILIALVLVTVATASAGIHMPDMLMAPAGVLAMLFIYGNFVDPIAHAHRFKLNPIAIFVSIVFWSWIWGARVPSLPCRSWWY